VSESPDKRNLDKIGSYWAMYRWWSTCASKNACFWCHTAIKLVIYGGVHTCTYKPTCCQVPTRFRLQLVPSFGYNLLYNQKHQWEDSP
jgi:hypothetical protein